MSARTKNKKRNSSNAENKVDESSDIIPAAITEPVPAARSRFTERSEYLDERKLIIQLKDGASQRFDQILTTLSSAALGFSIVIVKDLLKMPGVKVQYLLVLAWISWFASLLSVLLSLLLSESVLSRMLENVDAEYQNQSSKSAWLETVTKYNNIISLICFFLGVLFFLIFIGNNFEWRA